jgi:Ca-activated chloride channel family protein|tara:strand:+ start:3549 stop:4334 length:786 start_codon:yes stop_codon:yes gene_type:complete
MNKATYILIFFCLIVYSQESTNDNYIFEGNKKIEQNDFIGAEMDYRNSLSNNPNYPKGLYNLGNAQYNSSAYDEAVQQFFRTQKFSKNKLDKHSAFHNMGNVYMKKKEYDKAVESYKSALRNNPSDDETRYNYALAKSLLKKEKNNDNKGNEENNDKNNKEKKSSDKNNEKNEKEDDEKNQKEGDGKDKEEKDQKNDNQKGKEKNNDLDNKQQSQKQAKGRLSPEQVKSLLDAMNNQEKKVQDKINAKKIKGVPLKSAKDW